MPWGSHKTTSAAQHVCSLGRFNGLKKNVSTGGEGGKLNQFGNTQAGRRERMSAGIDNVQANWGFERVVRRTCVPRVFLDQSILRKIRVEC